MNDRRKKINYGSNWIKKLESLRNRILVKIAIFANILFLNDSSFLVQAES